MLVLRIISSIISLLGFYQYGYCQAPTLGVVVETAVLGQASQQIEALGTAKANEVVDISVSVAETVKQIHFDSGQRVSKGDILLELEDSEEQALLKEFQFTLDEAKRQLRRIQQLANQGDASQSLLDEKQREYNVGMARLTAIKSRLNDRIIRAPFSGMLGLRDISPGAFVAPGSVITRLVDDSTIKLDFEVPAIHLNDLSLGNSITATSKALGNQTFIGTVHSIDNHIDPVTRSIKVRALLPNPNHQIKPGLLMVVYLHSKPRQAIFINEAAIVQQGLNAFVFLAVPSQNQTDPDTLIAKKISVITGIRQKGKVEIKQGLQPGDKIIVHGNMKTRDGSPITLKSSATGADNP